MSLLEPLIDTVVICTMTALVIIITGQLISDPETGLYVLDEAGVAIQTVSGASGVALTSAAFGEAISWFPIVLAVAVVLFAFSTMISWSYYGLKAWTYLFGEGRISELVFKLIFCVFIVIGAAANLGPVIDFSDAAIFSMAVVNIIGLYFLMGIVKRGARVVPATLKSGRDQEVRLSNEPGHAAPADVTGRRATTAPRAGRSRYPRGASPRRRTAGRRWNRPPPPGSNRSPARARRRRCWPSARRASLSSDRSPSRTS